MKIEFEMDVSQFPSQVGRFMDEVWNQAMVDALNTTARDAVRALRLATSEVFDRPTPFTQDAFSFIPASPRSAPRDGLRLRRPG